jgi:hypothetical protein
VDGFAEHGCAKYKAFDGRNRCLLALAMFGKWLSVYPIVLHSRKGKSNGLVPWID